MESFKFPHSAGNLKNITPPILHSQFDLMSKRTPVMLLMMLHDWMPDDKLSQMVINNNIVVLRPFFNQYYDYGMIMQVHQDQ